MQTEEVIDAEALVIRMDRRRAAWGALLSGLFVTTGASLVGKGGVATTIVGVLALAFFGSGLLVLLLALARPPVVLTLDPSGVHIGALLRFFRQSVPWTAIKAVRVYRLEAVPLAPRMRMLGLVPRHPGAAIWRTSRLMRRRLRSTGVPVSIVGSSIGIELEQVVEKMLEFCPDLAVEYGQPRAGGLGKLTRRTRHVRRPREATP